MVSWRSCCTLCMAITVSTSVDIEVAVAKHHATSRARKASRMILAAHVRLQILTFNTAIASSAQGPVEPVVVVFTVRSILKHVELCSWKGIRASSADKTLFMITTSQTTRGVLDRLPDDGLRASAAVPFAARSARSSAFGLSCIGAGSARWAPSLDRCRVYSGGQFAWTSNESTTLNGRIHWRFRWVGESWRQ